MSKTLRIGGDYSIISANQTPGNEDPGFATINLDTNLVIIDADVQVDGKFSADTLEFSTSDNIITLNDGEAGAGVTAGAAGIEIDRGSETNSNLLYDEALDKWTLDQGNGTTLEIATFAPGGSFLADVIEDLTPQLGGDLDVNGNSIIALINTDINLAVSGFGEITMTGPLNVTGTVTVAGADPTSAVAGTVTVFQDADSGGGTQLHYRNDTDTGELISKTKAIAYSLIL